MTAREMIKILQALPEEDKDLEVVYYNDSYICTPTNFTNKMMRFDDETYKLSLYCRGAIIGY